MEDVEATFKNNVAIAVSISILLWKDATPMTTFPSIDELVRIELGRVLSHVSVLADFPWLRGRLASIWGQLTSEPWYVHPPDLLKQYIRAVETPSNPSVIEAVGNSIRNTSFTDPAFYIIRRRGRTPRATADSMIVTSRGVAETLEIPETQFKAIEDGVRSKYTAIYSQISVATR